MVTARVVVRDRGAKSVVKSLTQKDKRVVDVGILGDKAGAPAEGGLTVAQVAEFHEFGLGVPQRSFLRAWADAEVAKIDRVMGKLVRRTLTSGLTRAQALEQLGLWAVGQVQGFISGGRVEPALSERTVKAKGSSVPLIDTGQLRSSITYEVRSP